MTVDMVTGRDALSLLDDDVFQKDWAMLYETCPWATVFQSVGFVAAWYKVYQDRFTPIILTQSDPDRALVGLLALAASPDGSQLVVAGAHQAEYQVWLASPAHGNSFIEAAIARVRVAYPGRALCFKYLPASAPREWTDPGRRWGGYCRLEPHRRPLLKLDAGTVADVSRRLRKKGRLARLRKLGDVRFEEIRNPAAMASVLDEVVPYYDFRHGALDDSVPFQSDPLKRPVHLAWMHVPGLLHITVLRVDDKIIAANVGLVDRDQVCLGVFLHSPFQAWHSPGTLHLYLLAEYLAKQGFAALDLTPGGDWKERFATDHDETHVLTVFARRRESMARQLGQTCKALVKRGLHAAGIPPQDLTGLFQRARRVRLTALSRRVSRRLWDNAELRVYVFEAGRVAALENPRLMSRDCLADLLSFQVMEAWQARRDFLAQSLKRLEEGIHVYTRAEHGRLVHYGWLIERQERAFFPEVGQPFQFPPGSAVLFDFYTDPSVRGRGLYQASLRQMLHDAAAIPGTRQVYICVLADNGPSRHVIEKVGFRHEISLFRRLRWGRAARWSTETPAGAHGGRGDRARS
jgi:RimJ/RimL family protein N-acetyltransferase